jgi:hypothetical protein
MFETHIYLEIVLTKKIISISHTRNFQTVLHHNFNRQVQTF